MCLPSPDNPLIVQADHTILVEVDSPKYTAARDALAGFAELVKAPEHVHTYRLTPLSIWNARAAGIDAETIIASLDEFAKYAVPSNVKSEIRDYSLRYGRLKLIRDDRGLILTASDEPLAEHVSRHKHAGQFLLNRAGDVEFLIQPHQRGDLKQALVKAGFPAEDLAGYVEGEPLPLLLREVTRAAKPFGLRNYQQNAVDAFHAGGSVRGGSGVITLPCGAGKTVVGIALMAKLQCSTLILTTGVTAARQWISEILDKTDLREDQISEYTGETKTSAKQIKPVTVATYQILTWRKKSDGEFPHLKLFDERNWGLIIYDEVHLLPAPVFRATASLQARRRLGLTATLVREDGAEDDVFALIGPKKADVPWRILEAAGWIAKANCTEIRMPMPEHIQLPYAMAPARDQFRIASENPLKIQAIRQVLRKHPGEPTLIIGMYVEQLEQLAQPLDIPVLTGTTPQKRRDEIFGAFREGKLKTIAVSKIANFAIDLPEASVAIQISGTFGSRQEEAQRLGRILRPKSGDNQAHFYTLVSRDTVEQDFSLKRQLFLCEQGYSYTITDFDDEKDGAEE